jgi:flagellar biogenesis protein FliO
MQMQWAAQKDSSRTPGLLQAAMGALIRLAGARNAAARRRMQVVETLALGGRKQLLLVNCDGERFLVGTGADQVQSIVRLGRETAESML